jgi:hypothetical protein
LAGVVKNATYLLFIKGMDKDEGSSYEGNSGAGQLPGSK